MSADGKKKGKTPRKTDDKVVVVEVVEGRNLVAMDSCGTSDPYVLVTCGPKKKKKTKIIYSTLNPMWEIGSSRERFVFSSKTWQKAKSIVCKCMDWDHLKSDDRMGMVEIPISTFENNPRDEWFALVPQKTGDPVSGELHLKLYTTTLSVSAGNSALWKAVQHTRLAEAQELLRKSGANMKEQGEGGQSLLHLAASIQEISEIAKDVPLVLMALLQHPEVDVNLVDESGNTPLHTFCRSFKYPSSDKPFKLFLDKGANVNTQNKHGETPLHQSLLNSSLKVQLPQLLLEHRANPNMTTVAGDTPLHYAVQMGRVDMVKLLIANGADCQIKNKKGNASELAIQFKFTEMAEIIKDSVEIIEWLTKYNLQKYKTKFLDEQLYVYLLSEVTEKWLTDQCRMSAEDKAKFIAAPKDKKDNRKAQAHGEDEEEKKKTAAARQKLMQSMKGPQSPSWELDIQELEFIKQLGEGTSGTVYKGVYQARETVAIKVLKPANGEKELDEFIREFSIMINIKSPYIVQFYGATLKGKLCMVMEFCERGSLYDVLQDDTLEIGWDKSFQMLKQIVMGIQVLHNNNPPIMHRDMKTLNVLVTKDFSCRLADFGLSRFDTVSNLETLVKCRGTYAYIAPEGMDGKTFKYSVRSDIYSIAIMIWEFVHRCVTGIYQRPYYDLQNVVVEFTILVQAAKFNKRPKMPDKAPQSLVKLITEAWHKDPNQRPDANQLLERLETIHKEYTDNKATWDASTTPKPQPKPKPEKKEEGEEDDSSSSDSDG